MRSRPMHRRLKMSENRCQAMHESRSTRGSAVFVSGILVMFAGCTRDTPTEPTSVTPAQAIAVSAERDCAPDQIPCGGLCMSIGSDAHNCGQCGAACASGEICHGGRCAVLPRDMGGPLRVMTDSLRSTLPSARSRCHPGFANCGSGCTDLRTSRLHCGRCGQVCPASQSCVMGNCT